MCQEDTKPLVAILTFGILYEWYEHPSIAGFMKRSGHIVEKLPQVPGFVQLVGSKGGDSEPRSPFFQLGIHASSAETLSTWLSLEDLFHFSYTNIHAEALGRRKEWFFKADWPTYVMWWVDNTHTPSWEDAYERQLHLHQNGPTPHAFDFARAFDPTGLEIQINRRRLLTSQRAGNAV